MTHFELCKKVNPYFRKDNKNNNTPDAYSSFVSGLHSLFCINEVKALIDSTVTVGDLAN